MSERSKDEIVEEMAEHHLAIAALLKELARAEGGRRKAAQPRENVLDLRRKVERKVRSNGES